MNYANNHSIINTIYKNETENISDTDLPGKYLPRTLIPSVCTNLTFEIII